MDELPARHPGIGLVLLGAATGVDPLWDRFLLLSPLRLEPLS
jgi:hypothetical protein